MWHRRQVRRIRLGEDSIVGDELHDVIVLPLLERHDTAERDIPTGIERRRCKSTRSGEAVHHSFYSRVACLAHHRARVVLRIPRMDDHRHIQLARERQLFGESTTLREPRRVVVVIIETTLADRGCTRSNERSKFGDVARRLEALSIVRMNSSAVREIPRMSSGERRRIAGGGENIALAAPRSDADYRAGPGDAGPLDYLVAVAGERRIGEVRVAVDEVWNADVLRGHFLSIHRSTGLAT